MLNANDIPLFKKVSREVHPKDEMFKTAKIALPQPGAAFHYYFYAGGRVATRVADYLRGRGLDPGELSLLDFACGYGRVTRYFVALFREVTCSDLEPTMLQFAKEQFGASGFLSNVDLDKVRFPNRRFDVVFSFSLFTHLNPEIWRDWFWAVLDKVEPGGHFIFSTRGVEFARKQGEPVGEGEVIRFTERNETAGRLDANIYGQTTIARAFVEDVIASRPGLADYLDYFGSGKFDMYQDMHVLQRRR